MGHEGPPDREHLLLAARDVAGRAPCAGRAGAGSSRTPARGPRFRRVPVAPRVAAGQEVLLHRQVLEDVAALHHLDDAAPDHLGGVLAGGSRRRRNSMLALGHLAPLGPQQPRDGLERGGLARAVGPEEGDDALLGNLERHALQHEDHVVVDHLDVVDRQQRVRGDAHTVARPTSPSSSPASCSRASCPPRPPPPRASGGRRPASGATQSDTMFHFLPSHCWNSTGPLPSWSSHVTFTGWVKPFMPSWSSRCSVRFRFSKPQRTCSPVSGLLPNLRHRGADGLDAEHGVDDAAVVEHLADRFLLARALALVVDVLDDLLRGP